MRIPWNRCSTMQYSLGIGTLAYFWAKPCATILFLSSQWHSGEVGKINTNNPAKPIMIPNKPAADICRLHNQSAIIYQLYPRIWSYLIVKTLSTTLELMFKSHSIYPIMIHYIYISLHPDSISESQKKTWHMVHGPLKLATIDGLTGSTIARRRRRCGVALAAGHDLLLLRLAMPWHALGGPWGWKTGGLDTWALKMIEF